MDSVQRPRAEEVCVRVGSEVDVVTARQRGREFARQLGLSACDATLIATAISELARNIITYAQEGEIVLRAAAEGRRRGLTIVATDSGPGIADLKRALEEGYSSSGGLGLGLPGVRRIMDEFAIDSEPGRGTEVRVTKWS